MRPVNTTIGSSTDQHLRVDYSTVIFSQVGLDANLSAILAAVLNTVFWMGTLPALRLLDSFGRRGLMMWTAVCMSVLMAAFSAL